MTWLPNDVMIYIEGVELKCTYRQFSKGPMHTRSKLSMGPQYSVIPAIGVSTSVSSTTSSATFWTDISGKKHRLGKG